MAEDPSSRPGIVAQDQSFGLLTLVPAPPVFGWLTTLDAQMRASASFAASRLVALDLSMTLLHAPGIRTLVKELEGRGFRVAGLTGLDPSQLGEYAAQMPPILAHVHPPPVPPREPVSLLIEDNVRSGQRIHCPGGDVTVVGSVSSGAEIVAGGTIHIYGKLRGRALAGLAGDPAQIFCRGLDAELLAIGGIALVAEDMDPGLRGRAVRAWVEQGAIRLASLE